MPQLRLVLELARPATLPLPMLGIFAGGLVALRCSGAALSLANTVTLILAALAAAVLNAASNSLNQVYDLSIDQVNKPFRPLPQGRIGADQVLRLAGLEYLAALSLAASLSIWTGVLFALAALATCIYSIPWLGRTKRLTLGSNLTIAIPRGALLKVAGWSLFADLDQPEPWLLGAIFFLFLLGASSSKDFSDLEGDQRNGCLTLPVRFGSRQAATIIAPCFILPWALFPLGALCPDPWHPGLHLLSASPRALMVLAVGLGLWGVWVVRRMIADPLALTGSGNHPAWTQMLAMATSAQLGLVAAYWF